ncbi:MAG: hypothetical protein E7638_02200 [Ruminococcaceae bacterium]|nr:hypothetical protein [Oscillospiraceae bacterium]
MNERKSTVGRGGGLVGVSSLFVIFAVLCLTIFALLAIEAAMNDERMSLRSLDTTVSFYKAETEAERILAELRVGQIPTGVAEENGVFSYSCPISETMHISVCVAVGENGAYQILQWQTVSDVVWEEDTGIDVWDGNT